MKRKRLVIIITLFIGISLTALSIVTFTPISAQVLLQAVATSLPDRPISPHFPLPPALTKQFTGSNFDAQPAYSTYMRLTDDTGSLSIEVPTAWTDVGTGVWTVGGKALGVYIAAAPDLGSFNASRAEPGIFFGASTQIASIQGANRTQTPNSFIGQMLTNEAMVRPGVCQNGGRFAYQDNFYLGNYDLTLNCSTGNRGEIDLVTLPPSQQYFTLLRIHLNSHADLDAATHILDTFQVTNPTLKDDG